MAVKITMPQLGESVTEGTISSWLVAPGSKVNKYDPLCEVTTDKVNAEVPSSFAGTITEIVAQEGETVAVGALICYIEVEGAGAAEAETNTTVAGAQPPAAAAPTPAAAPAPVATPAAAPTAAATPTHAPVQQPVDRGEKARYSPAVLSLAQEHQLDLSQIPGTGMGGRITRKDVLRFVEQGGARQGAAVAQAPAAVPGSGADQARQAVAQTAGPAAAPAAVGKAVSKAQQIGNVAVNPGDQLLPVTPVRRVIASRMKQSKHEAPHAWTITEVDVTGLVKLRDQMKDEFLKKEGVKLTYLPFFVKAAVEALKEYPILNSIWTDEQIVIRKDINISLAVATDDALYVPVIKNTDRLSILGIAQAINDLADRTRRGKLTMEDMQGGTFTVNNTGSFGSIISMPIINYPQAAILAVESIVKRPVVIDDMIAVRHMINLCLSFDHRILDGLVSGHFMQSLKAKLESYGPGMSLY